MTSDSGLPPLAYVTALIKLCKEQGVQRVKLGEVELDLGPREISGPDAVKMRELAEALTGGTMTEEDALFGSAPGFISQEKAEEMLKRFSGQG
jgi:hypothetical protein